MLKFAEFDSAKAKRVLENDVGLGAEHQRYAQAGADLYGIDVTERAAEHTQLRLAMCGLSSQLAVGDAEKLDFPNEYFDQIYSWGVLRHSPDTLEAVTEVWRVLKKGVVAKAMIYQKRSTTGLMLWIRYALLVLCPWLSLTQIYSRHLESPGTKAYSVAQVRQLFSAFGEVEIRNILTHSNLLESDAG